MTISLDEALKRLEQEHQVTFLYRLDVVDGKTVPNVESQQKKLTNRLEKLLKPFDLKYRQISNNYFVILPRHASSNQEPVRDEQSTNPETDPLNPGAENSLLLPTESLAAMTVKGTVSDEKGQGLPGVSVLLKGTTTGTAILQRRTLSPRRLRLT